MPPPRRVATKALLSLGALGGAGAGELDTTDGMLRYLRAHPSRAYFSRLLRDGPYDVAMEVGVADGRFSEHFLIDGRPKTWWMVEPFPNAMLRARYPPAGGSRGPGDHARPEDEALPEPWAARRVGEATEKKFVRALSLDAAVLDAVAPGSVDFVYLDGAHDYVNVKKELEPYWRMLRPGGMLAGHDYCSYGETPLKCRGCADVPPCIKYTEYGVRHGKRDRRSMNQWGVVRAVQEWMLQHPELELHHTRENFTRASLAADGMDYDLVITNTFNPSWYVFKPGEPAPRRAPAPGPRPATTCGAAVAAAGGVAANPACAERFQAFKKLEAPGADLTVAYLYYKDDGYLKRHADHWATLSADVLKRVAFLVVDDGSPEEASARGVLERTESCDVRAFVLKIGEDLRWNIGGARNLAFALAPTELVLMVDADQLVTQAVLEWSLRRAPDALGRCDVFLDFRRKLPTGFVSRKAHPATMLASRASYWRVGGCDEDFVGNYGYTDMHFSARLKQNADCRRIRSNADPQSSIFVADAPAAEPAPPLVHIEPSHARHSPRTNKALFHAKTRGTTPWSSDYLRFSWTTAFDSAADHAGRCSAARARAEAPWH